MKLSIRGFTMIVALGMFLPTLVWGASSERAPEPLPKPSGRVILTITGSIDETNERDAARFDLEMLKALGTITTSTWTPWTEGKPEFEAVLVRDVLEAVVAEGETVEATALNDYRIEIPMSDFEKYDVFLAFEMNGERLTIRDKGPLWLVYPFTANPELQNTQIYSRAIWQLKSLHIR